MSADVSETIPVSELGTGASGRMIRIARYSAYPRAATEHAVQTGFTRSGPDGLLHLITATPEPVGALLRVRIQDLDARDGGDTLARVVDCNGSGGGRFELTLEALEAHRPRLVRRDGRRAQSG